MNQRVPKLRGKLDENGLDAALISNPQSRRYLSGFTGSAGWLLISRDETIIATDFRYYEQSAQQAPSFRLHKVVGPFEGWMASLIGGASVGGRKLAFEAADVSYATYKELRKVVEALPETDRPHLAPTTNLIESLRVIKEPEEIAAIQDSIDL